MKPQDIIRRYVTNRLISAPRARDDQEEVAKLLDIYYLYRLQNLSGGCH
jgi:hypothetical protein